MVKGDVLDRGCVREAVDGVDVVVHLAALIDVEQSATNPLETHNVNVNGTLNVLNEGIRKGVKRFLFASSAAVYGEGSLFLLKEDFPLRPISPYATSKAAGEPHCGAFHRSNELGTVILRYFNVYGPRWGHNPYCGVIASFLRNAFEGRPLVVYGDGEQHRDFICLDDVVQATMLALECNDSARGDFQCLYWQIHNHK